MFSAVIIKLLAVQLCSVIVLFEVQLTVYFQLLHGNGKPVSLCMLV
mgnify:CR=1 FL=1